LSSTTERAPARGQVLVLFAGSLAAVAALATGIVTGRTWTPNLSQMQWRLLIVGAVSTIALSWALKVFVLGN